VLIVAWVVAALWAAPADAAGTSDSAAAVHGSPAAADSGRAPAGAVRDSLPLVLRDAAPAPSAPPTTGTLEPSGVAADAFGRVFASDARGHRLVRFDPVGAWLGGEGTLGSDPGQFRRPGAVALHGTLDVVVLDRENRRLARYDLLGRYKGILIDFEDSALEAQLGRIDPADVASDRGGGLAVADRDGDRVLIFDVSGEFVRALGGFGGSVGAFRGVAGIAYTRRGDLVVAERVGRRLQRLEPGGRSAARWSLPVAPGEGAVPVAVDDGDRIAVADERSGRLWLFDPSGRLVAMRSDLEGPRALAFAPDGTLLVAEAAGGRLRRLTVRSASDSTVGAK
jgi:sugar lactone lactonase YvrE